MSITAHRLVAIFPRGGEPAGACLAGWLAAPPRYEVPLDQKRYLLNMCVDKLMLS